MLISKNYGIRALYSNVSDVSSCYKTPRTAILKLVMAMYLRKIFGKNVRYYRFLRSMTQEKLAELTDLSSRYISNVENGEGNVSLDTIELFAKALNVSCRDLFDATPKEVKAAKVNLQKETIKA